MANVLLGVTGSVAAIRTPELFAALRQADHQVKVVATRAALYFFDPAALAIEAGAGATLRAAPATVPDPFPATLVASKDLFVDDDEWPGREQGRRYRRDDPVLHVELRRWAERLVLAPLDANTLAKLANGLADNCLTCVWRAWDLERPVVLAPAMNTLMWQHPLTTRHLRLLTSEDPACPAALDPDAMVEWINRTQRRLHVVPPQTKRLACGDVGVGAMAEVGAIVAAVNRVS